MKKFLLFTLLALLPLQVSHGVATSCDVSVSLCDDAVTTAKILNDAVTTGKVLDGTLGIADFAGSALATVDVNLTAGQMDALNATPITVIAAPGSGIFLDVISVTCVNTFLTTAFELGSGTVDFRYENSSGGLAAQLTNAYVESAATAYFKAPGLAAVALANKALVAYASADVTAGAGSLNCRVLYRTILASDV